MEHTKRAIVVGGSSGIGFEVCSKLINRNWNVTNISRTPCKLEKVINEIADVTAGSTFTDIIDRACRKNATVDVLIYSAGFSMASPIEFAKEKDYRYLFDVNFFGALKAMQAVIPYMLEQGKGNRVVGIQNNRIVDYDINEALDMVKDIDEYLYKVAYEISI